MFTSQATRNFIGAVQGWSGAVGPLPEIGQMAAGGVSVLGTPEARLVVQTRYASRANCRSARRIRAADDLEVVREAGCAFAK